MFELIIYGTGVPAASLYEDHPQYKPVFIAALILDGLAFLWFMSWGIRRYLRQSAARKSSA